MRELRNASTNVYLFFLIKKGESPFEDLKKRIKKEYKAADVPYYFNNGKYMEVKYHFHSNNFEWSSILTC
jgi:hypothetical protein